MAAIQGWPLSEVPLYTTKQYTGVVNKPGSGVCALSVVLGSVGPDTVVAGSVCPFIVVLGSVCPGSVVVGSVCPDSVVVGSVCPLAAGLRGDKYTKAARNENTREDIAEILGW